MADDDRALMERLAALEAEVKGDADAQRARKEAAVQRVREQRAAQQAERDELRARQAAIVKKEPLPRPKAAAKAAPEIEDAEDDDDGITSALALAKRANNVKKELAKPRKKGQKSYLWSGGLSLFFGPLGWLYAGSWREAAPASLATIVVGWIVSHLPSIIMMPALLFFFPASAIVGLLYAWGYNKHGKRQRLFGENKDRKQLKGG